MELCDLSAHKLAGLIHRREVSALEVLESTLETFDGTVIVISHDRYLLDRIPDRILEVRDGRVTSSIGGFDDWAAARR